MNAGAAPVRRLQDKDLEKGFKSMTALLRSEGQSGVSRCAVIQDPNKAALPDNASVDNWASRIPTLAVKNSSGDSRTSPSAARCGPMANKLPDAYGSFENLRNQGSPGRRNETVVPYRSVGSKHARTVPQQPATRPCSELKEWQPRLQHKESTRGADVKPERDGTEPGREPGPWRRHG